MLNASATKSKALSSKKMEASKSHSLGLLASAVVGRTIRISYIRNPKITAHCDLEYIYLQRDTPLAIQRQQVLVQAALITGGALQAKQIARIAGRVSLGQRYFVLEVERCCLLLENILPSRLLTKLALTSSQIHSSNPCHSLQLALGNSLIPPPPAWFGSLQAFRVLKKLITSSGTNVNETTAASLEKKIKSLQNYQDDEVDERKIEKTSFWQLLSSPLKSGGMLSNILQEILGMTSGPESTPSESTSAGSTETVKGKVLNNMGNAMQLLQSTLAVLSSNDTRPADQHTHQYDEWNHTQNRYRPRWVTIEEVEPYQEGHSKGTINFNEHLSRQYQFALANLRINYQPHKHQPKGDSIVLDDLVNLTIDLAAGQSGDANFYQASLKTRRDLGVQILLDISSSTKETTHNNKRIYDIQLEAAWQLCCAFHALGDRVALHGFHSWGRNLVRFQRLKSFDDSMGGRVRQRIENLSASGYTRTGAAIRHASKQLNVCSGMPHNLLIIITDGYPYDDEYEGRYAWEDTRKALEEARNDNIACVCISLATDANTQQLISIYGETNFISLETTQTLAQQIRTLIESAVADLKL